MLLILLLCLGLQLCVKYGWSDDVAGGFTWSEVGCTDPESSPKSKMSDIDSYNIVFLRDSPKGYSNGILIIRIGKIREHAVVENNIGKTLKSTIKLI